ncbi:MAG: hypothetical protein A3J93_03300 [Candidatus Magasanikbacteria bacterium RIFOXYC2_FULL_42_28]|uniref:NlpC/P60 domain-containing protein n=1 Tax=Candidatus Magasanikbacteria bacterium RIFOXYC2_FULL_42_28 TaxID=1798704 RepID=A0A1F6NUI5_9BACT|nr:MAG: hypothetical protein A3J93_03300 [Candidatus Magasanikbacteria bacterium RIFOXYC2_FULL_42_28]
MRKVTFFLLFTTLVLLAPGIAEAVGTAPIGTECTPADNNGMCASGDCEESNVPNPGTSGNRWYCDCDFDSDCDIYGTPKSGDWDCEDGYAATYRLDYCVDESGDKTSASVKAPIGMDPNFSVEDLLTVLFGNREVLQQKILSSIEDDINDKLAIRIPGLNFSNLSGMVDGDGYMYIPWLGEYIKAIYNYALGIISIVAVIMIILQGARIITSGGGEGKTEGLKKIGHVVIGLVIAWSSYAILYTINPALTEFKPLKLMYVRPIELDTEGEPDTTPASAQNLTVISAPDLNGCKLENYKIFQSSNQLFGTAVGQCLRWVKQSWANACLGKIPQTMNAVGAWDVAVNFQKGGKFHPCNLDGIKNGDLVFMTSRGSNYIGLWENFRNGPDGCTIADTATTPRYSKQSTILKYNGSLNRTIGIPPVTHIGVYYDGNVYHQIGRVASDAVSDIKPLKDVTTKKPLWVESKAKLDGNFYHDGAEFIAGYGSWQ